MQYRSVLRGALLMSALSAAACGGDDTNSTFVPTPDGGGDATSTSNPEAGAPADASAPADGGDDGTAAHADASDHADTGIPGDAGVAADSNADALADVAAEASTLDGGGGGDTGDAGPPAYALFVGSDFVNAELSVVALNPDSVAGRLPLADQDSIPVASGGLGFVLERGLGTVIALGTAQPWTARATIDINDSPEAGAYASNPHALVVTAGTKAYVARYATNTIKIVDVASGAATGTIDLSAFVAPDDTDGLVDVTDAAYDPASHRAYFLLQRINQFDYSGSAPDFVAACLTSHGEIVAVDSATDAVVPLSDAGTGALDLLGDDPGSITPDFANGRLIVTEAGCYENADGGADAGPTIRLGRGIESVSLTGAAPSWLYQTSDVQRLSGLVWVDGTHAYVNLGTDWFPWNPTQTTLGDAVTGFPLAPFYDGAGRIVGLSAAPPAAGSEAGVNWSVVAWAIPSGSLSTIAAAPFQSVVPSAPYGVASALLR